MYDPFITPIERQQQLTTPQPSTVSDVRSTEKYAADHHAR